MELGISSLGELLGYTESALADRWLITGQYNLMREALSNISWEYDRDMNVDITERNLQKNRNMYSHGLARTGMRIKFLIGVL